MECGKSIKRWTVILAILGVTTWSSWYFGNRYAASKLDYWGLCEIDDADGVAYILRWCPEMKTEAEKPGNCWTWQADIRSSEEVVIGGDLSSLPFCVAVRSPNTTRMLLRKYESCRGSHLAAFIACYRDDVSCLTMLHASGLDLLELGYDGGTILHNALAWQRQRVANYLLNLAKREDRLAAVLSSHDDSGAPPLKRALIQIPYQSKIHPSETLIPPRQGYDEIIEIEDLEILEEDATDWRLLDHVLDLCPEAVEYRDSQGRTLLHTTAELNDFEFIDILLKLKVKINAVDKKGRNAFHHLFRCNKDEHPWVVAPDLRRAGCSLTQQDKDGNTPIHVLLDPRIEQADPHDVAFLDRPMAIAAYGERHFLKSVADAKTANIMNNAGETILDLLQLHKVKGKWVKGDFETGLMKELRKKGARTGGELRKQQD